MNKKIISLNFPSLMLERYSSRRYKDTPVSESTVQSLQELITTIPDLSIKGMPVNTESIKMEIIRKQDYPTFFSKIATLKYIENNPAHLFGLIRNTDFHDPVSLLNFGYKTEHILLEAKRRGIDSCFIGGSFLSRTFRAFLKDYPDYTLIGASALGYGTGRKDRTKCDIKHGRDENGNNSRLKSWETIFFNETVTAPISQSIASSSLLQKTLTAIWHAPSSCNSQPWKVAASGNQLHLYLARNIDGGLIPLTFQRVTGKADLQTVDMGVAMLHAEYSLKNQGIDGVWEMAQPEIATPPKWDYIASFVTKEDLVA